MTLDGPRAGGGFHDEPPREGGVPAGRPRALPPGDPGGQFTRGRPYKKDDNAHIEQKNWTHVRKLVGYLRYDTPAAVAALNALYRHELRFFQNLFLPSVKLIGKERVGARLRRRYDAPRLVAERPADARQRLDAYGPSSWRPYERW